MVVANLIYCIVTAGRTTIDGNCDTLSIILNPNYIVLIFTAMTWEGCYERTSHELEVDKQL
jgi:hypothetical protein